MVADKAYGDDKLRILLFEEGIFPCFSATSKRTPLRPFHRGYYRRRHRVENCFCELKKRRRVATRYDKLASSYLAFVRLAATLH
ncbi:MAG: transposase [Chthoniobacteraceae bacterium]|nr:transposase [Chthoniobacteraceae bacterium]